MMARFLLIHFISLLLAGSWAQAQAPKSASLFAGSKTVSNVVVTPHARVELMAFAPDGVQAGRPLWLGLQIQHQPAWHTYWKNPGDSGLATQLAWTLPAGLTAGDVQWPTPKKIPVAQLANYGYEGTVLLPVPVTVSNTFAALGVDITVTLKAQWLICKTECIPEEGEFTLKLPVRGSTASNRPLFDNALGSLPKVHAAKSSFTPQEKLLKLSVADLPAHWRGKILEAFPEEGEVIETAAKPEQSWAGAQWTAQIPLNAQRSNSPTKMMWLVKIAGGQANPAVRVEATLDGAWQGLVTAKPASINPALVAALEKNKIDTGAAADASSRASSLASPAATSSWMSATYWLAILGAMLGGLILNLMPCVLPVLAIKLLSFAPKKVLDAKSSVAMVKFDHAGFPVVRLDDTLTFRASSGLFALGVISTFVLLGGALLVFRAAGQSFGWGFQLQSPSMVVALAVLFMLIGLNLFDAFDIRFLLPPSVANFQSKNPNIEALVSGALAVLIATPCTAPFMGASLGLAITLPVTQSLLIFAALGMGMALPFILMAIVPGIGAWLLKVLPRPGPWMTALRYVLAWPVFVTALWLLWIYGQQTSMTSVFAVMLSLLLGTALLWSLRLHAGTFKLVINLIFAACLLASFYLWSPTSATQNQNSAQTSRATPTSSWTNWTVQKQAEAMSAGRPVFVDFTAAWCMTCQVNKSTTLNTADVQAAFKAKNVLMLRADWTAPDAAIAAELEKLGRTGLPVYALYYPGDQKPKLLPEVLTKALVVEALDFL